MNTQTTMKHIWLLFSLLTGCASTERLHKELSNEGFPGIHISMEEQFAKSYVNAAEFPFSLILENKRENSIKINRWAATIISANQGNGVSSFSKIHAEPIVLQPGDKHELNGYLYLGPDKGTRNGQLYFSKSVGRDADHLPMMSSERKYGDCLVGLRMSLEIDQKHQDDLYLVKYHFDESEDTIVPYYTLAEPSQLQRLTTFLQKITKK